MRRLFEFICSNDHVTEQFVEDSVRATKCGTCSKDAGRMISAVRSSLEGISGSFPRAAQAWERKRAEKLKQERKQAS
tara:strand:+ start:2682 stop:2912 length:231 start_codon:yes stop_codon:yes gene_type:complete